MALISVTEGVKKIDYIPRSFYYHDIHALKKNSEEKFVEEDDQKDLFYRAFEKLESLYAEKAIEELSVQIENGDKIYVIPDLVERGNPICFRLILVRTNGFPLVEQEGALNSLTEFIPDEFGLAEITHCVIFPEYGLLGIEYNTSGARVNAIKEYLPRVDCGIKYIYCTPHLKDNVLEKIEDNELSLFQLKVKNTPHMRKYIMDSDFTFLLPIHKMPEGSTYEVAMKHTKRKDRDGFKSPMNKDEIGQFITDCGEDIQKFKISVGSIQGDTVDLLKQKVVYKTGAVRTENKSIDSKAAYKLMISYFNSQLKDTLDR